MNLDIVSYCDRFPGLDITDLFKFLHQSCFGCEHLVTDEARAIAMIREEMPCAARDCIGGVEPLDGPFARVHLDAIGRGLSVETLGKLFVLSSKKKAGGLRALNVHLELLPVLASTGKIPFDKRTLSDAIEQWRNDGYPACHHSEQFNRRYHPAYRVIAEEYVRYLPLFTAIDTKLQHGSLIVAIDGRCASGKTTLGSLLARLYDCNVFHMDDFFLQSQQRTVGRLACPGENVDHERFLTEVLLPTARGDTVFYRRYNCHTEEIQDAIPTDPKALTVIEGVYSFHDSLEPYYNLKVFSDVSAKVQKERILARNGGDFALRFFSEWIPLEEKYFAACRVQEKADLVFL